jgi:hypothetical protein
MLPDRGLCLVAGTRPVNSRSGPRSSLQLGNVAEGVATSPSWAAASGGVMGPRQRATPSGPVRHDGRRPEQVQRQVVVLAKEGEWPADRVRSLFCHWAVRVVRAAPFLSEPAHASPQHHRPRPASGCRQARRDHVRGRSPCAANTAAGQRRRGGAPAIVSRGRAPACACGRGGMRIRPPASQAALPSRAW